MSGERIYLYRSRIPRKCWNSVRTTCEGIHGKSISDVLNMTVMNAGAFFSEKRDRWQFKNIIGSGPGLHDIGPAT